VVRRPGGAAPGGGRWGARRILGGAGNGQRKDDEGKTGEKTQGPILAW
jgi:hypothetical protein